MEEGWRHPLLKMEEALGASCERLRGVLGQPATGYPEWYCAAAGSSADEAGHDGDGGRRHCVPLRHWHRSRIFQFAVETDGELEAWIAALVKAGATVGSTPSNDRFEKRLSCASVSLRADDCASTGEAPRASMGIGVLTRDDELERLDEKRRNLLANGLTLSELEALAEEFGAAVERLGPLEALVAQRKKDELLRLMQTMENT